MMSMVIKSEPKDKGDLLQTCRLCLSEESADNVFNEEGLHQWISDYLSIRISPDDHLSQAVCSICRIQLIEFHQFRERCQEVQNTLKSESRTESCDSYKGSIVPYQENQEADMQLESIQNEETDELLDIVEMKAETHDSTEFPASPNTDEHTNETFLNSVQTAAVHKEIDIDNLQSIVCRVCNKILGSIPRLENHEIVAQGLADFECVKCGLAYLIERNLQESKARGESVLIRKIQCKPCKLSFSRRTQLYNHNARKHKPKKFLCSTCQKLFSTRHDLYRHSSTHLTTEDDRPFECDICEKRFKLKHTADEHKKRVHGPKLFRCSVCGSCFSTNSLLNRHMTIHDLR